GVGVATLFVSPPTKKLPWLASTSGFFRSSRRASVAAAMKVKTETAAHAAGTKVLIARPPRLEYINCADGRSRLLGKRCGSNRSIHRAPAAETKSEEWS